MVYNQIKPKIESSNLSPGPKNTYRGSLAVKRRDQTVVVGIGSLKELHTIEGYTSNPSSDGRAPDLVQEVVGSTPTGSYLGAVHRHVAAPIKFFV